jgi:hypothetical protein
MPPKAHSEHGASVAARWLACPGSVRLSRGMENHETIHSVTGTAAHALAENCLIFGGEPHAAVGEMITIEGKSVDKVEVTEDMADAVKVYVDYCRALQREPGAHWWTELAIDLAELGPPEGIEMYGTSDFPIYLPAIRTLEVVDYKHGSGVVVEVKGNKQLRYYALGALLRIQREYPELDIDEVKITIVQPRAAHPDGPIRSETMTVLDLLAFSAQLMAGAEATQAPDAPLVPGDHCRFCPAAPVCPAQREQAQALAQVAFADMPVDVPPAPETLPMPVFADILGKLHILEDWARSMRQHAHRLVEQGEEVPGFKLVAKRANRKWVEEQPVIRMLRREGYSDEEIFKQDLKSPAQIEKLVGKKNLDADLWEKKSSGYVLVPTSDPREAVALPGEHVFPALSAGEDE